MIAKIHLAYGCLVAHIQFISVYSQAPGSACRQNIDCAGSAYCPNGVCVCRNGYIVLYNDCYRMVNPGESGCRYAEQCAAMWPQSQCTAGRCQCPSGYRPERTRDATICLKVIGPGGTPLPLACPTPEDAGFRTILLEGTTPVTCTPGSRTAAAGQACFADGKRQDDIYDCIRDAHGTGGVCCANRAFTCAQPLRAPKSGSGTETRFWFNQVSGVCETFVYNPTSTDIAEHGVNNFVSQQQCLAYCVDQSCKRGSPQYATTTADIRGDAKVVCNPNLAPNTIQSGCANNFECSAHGLQSYCCPKPSYICSRNGGRVNSAIEDFDDGWQADNKLAAGTTYTRYYFDANSRTCNSFEYLGEGGNFNNFATQTDCEEFCGASQCEQGKPLLDATGVNLLTCSGSLMTACPTSYMCRNSVCCPRPQHVCTATKFVGTGSARATRYWYNAVSQQCEAFVYSGRGGNANNFADIDTCRRFCAGIADESDCVQGSADKNAQDGTFIRCDGQNPSLSPLFGVFAQCTNGFDCINDGVTSGCCPSKPYTCSRPSDSGRVCNGPATTRYYYNADPANPRCLTFQYAGCDGNSNNFPSERDCMEYCGIQGCPDGGQAYSDGRSVRTCTSNQNCPNGFECTTVFLGGSGSTRNCCPTKAYICQQVVNTGQECGSGVVTRWYFQGGDCYQFNFYGCASNGNNFATKSQCLNFCRSAACPMGEVVQLDASGNAKVCQLTTLIGASVCSNGYTCRNLNQRYGAQLGYCCGSTGMGVCPSGQRAYVEADTLSARECSMNGGFGRTFGTTVVACDAAGVYRCVAGVGGFYGALSNRAYCCTAPAVVATTTAAPVVQPVTAGRCPTNYLTYGGIFGNGQGCFMNLGYSTCPSGYACQPAYVASPQGVCCSLSRICPNSIPQMDTVSYGTLLGSVPRRCTFGSTNSCTPPYSCATSAADPSNPNQGFCCLGVFTVTAAPTAVAPSPSCQPAMYMDNFSPLQCQQSYQCPTGYQDCRLASYNGRTHNMCCRYFFVG